MPIHTHTHASTYRHTHAHTHALPTIEMRPKHSFIKRKDSIDVSWAGEEGTAM